MNQRIVIKIGSSSLASPEGGLIRERVRFFAAEIASLLREGRQVLVVSSGAIAAGYRLLGYKNRPRLLYEKQAAAAVGQALLMQAYEEAFSEYGRQVAQILLTRPDFGDRLRARNALATLEELLRQGAVPVINENDTVSVDEIRFGDNDALSALTAALVKADGLYMLTDTDGLYTADPRKDPGARRIDRVDAITDELLRMAGGAGSTVGTGGMRSKIEAARVARAGGVPVFVGRVAEPGDLAAALRGEGKGTYFAAGEHTLPVKKLWIGYLSEPRGRIIVDAGAERAMVHGGKSLLPAGVVGAAGDFRPGDVAEVAAVDGRVIGRGIVRHSVRQVNRIRGLSSEEAMRAADIPRPEIIHRDEWVALPEQPKEVHSRE